MIISNAIKSNMLWLPNAELSESKVSEIKSDLTFKSYFDKDEEPEYTKIYKQTKTMLGVPWYYPDRFGGVKVRRVEDRLCRGSKEIQFEMLNQARDEMQRAILKQVHAEISKGVHGMIIKAPTAIGKTFLGISIVNHVKSMALIVVHKSDLLKQWRDAILEHTNIPVARIGLGKMGKIDWSDKWVVVALVHTLALRREDKEFYKHFGIVIFDEVDRSVPPKTFAPVSCMFPAKYRIALSATPKREDGLHKIFELNLGGAIIEPPRHLKAKRMDSVVIVKRYYSDRDMTLPKHLGPVMRKAIFLKKIEKDISRNYTICQWSKRFLNSSERRVVIMSERLLQLHLVRDMLIKQFRVKPETIGYYTASAVASWPGNGKPKMRVVKQAEQQATADNCSVLLATMKMMDSGTNIPDVSGMIIATPRRTLTQLLGRIERYMKGKKQPVLVYVLDVESDEARGWFANCLNELEARQLKIVYR